MPAKKPNQVRAQVKIRASAERVWAALVEPDQIKQWWGAGEAVIEPRKGGAWAVAWGGGQGYRSVACGVIRSIAPVKRLRIEPLVCFSTDSQVPGPLRMSFSVAEKGGLTRVIVRQEPIGDAPQWESYAQEAVTAWRQILENLKRLLEEASGSA
jgi:uncharacterized protein YndB with AHSA1/START domain